MKTVKINYANIEEGGFDKEQNLIYDVLKLNGFDVQITEDADFLICDVAQGNPYAFCGKPQVRIQYSGENYIPDFNLIDYSICPTASGPEATGCPCRVKTGTIPWNLSREKNTLPILSAATSRSMASGVIFSRSCASISGWNPAVRI